MRGVITLITDYGLREGYVGALKGVILTLAPKARIVDITHEIAPGGIDSAAFVLSTIIPWYPSGTVHLVVVDPGVGSARRGLVIESGGCLFAGPDNGCLEPAFTRDPAFNCFELTASRYRLARVSATFHGRDIFAPAAAHLALGIKPEKFGAPVHDPFRLTFADGKQIGPDRLSGRVIHADRFGNLITDITGEELLVLAADLSGLEVSIRGRRIRGISDFYGQAGAGSLLALIGGSGRLEVALSRGSALEELGQEATAAEVTVTRVTG